MGFLDSIADVAAQPEINNQKGLSLAILAIEYSTSNASSSNAYFDLLKNTRFSQNHLAFPSIVSIIGAYQKLHNRIKIPSSIIDEAVQILQKHDLFILCGYARLLDANYDYLDKNLSSMRSKIDLVLDHFERAEYPKGIADCYHILGIASRARKQDHIAISQFKQAIRNYGKIKSKVEMQALLNLASTFQHSNALDSAIFYYQKVEPFILSSNYPSLQAFLYSNWSIIYHDKGDTLKADSMREIVMRLSEQYSEETYEDYDFPSFFNLGKNTRSKRKIQNTISDWEEEKNKLLLNQLEVENKLKETKMKLQRLGLISSLIVGLMLIFITIILQRKNRKIHSQNKEKDTLLREIHHRVKNNLQIISSLLNLQTQKTKDTTAVQALKEGQSRVQSMSIIHQNLYQQNNLTAIDMQAYFKKLIKNLKETYHISDTSIAIHDHIEPMMLDVDTVVPLGLILNELITNSIKYAFPKKNGRIDVQLKEEPSFLYLSVSDNGIGIKQKGQNLEKGFGYEMIHAFSEQLEAEVLVDHRDGTLVSFKIKNYKIYNKS